MVSSISVSSSSLLITEVGTFFCLCCPLCCGLGCRHSASTHVTTALDSLMAIALVPVPFTVDREFLKYLRSATVNCFWLTLTQHGWGIKICMAKQMQHKTGDLVVTCIHSITEYHAYKCLQHNGSWELCKTAGPAVLTNGLWLASKWLSEFPEVIWWTYTYATE